ncbi:T9SS type A sorting domain-containing protein [Roseivirga spongicola]|uniref:T9SS type A sorting domain-containing protein n=1 Tax=Roseivirga spongicola TaxID=333140 RepID=UPI002AC9305D|nr:T9SS type A sorting domain-containing protein [Roseivirga spongicola]WPZ10814.1 T9SS type A sorting domain-containing protein [Roseivirga spongicola]
MRYSLTAFLLSFALSIQAQVQFKFDQSISVSENNEIMNRAFEGGLNSAQFQTMDLNGDGILDLVIFHRISRSLSTYLNINNQWIFSPNYQNLFPEDVVNWMILKDYDCDGQKDLFTSTALGIKVYRNTSTANGVSWELASEFLTWDSGSNIQVAPTDIPGIADVNGDGALDILTYRFGSAGSIDYYENTGNCGNLTFTRVTRTWGDFYDCGCNDFSFGQPCGTVGGFSNLVSEPSDQQVILHAGGKTITPFDADNDGDIDIIASDELCENLYFFRNEGSANQALMTAFETYPPDDPVSLQFFPAAFLEDINFDGLKDLVVSSNLDNNVGNLVDFQKNVNSFINLGSNENPDFNTSSAFLQNEMIDVGENAFPTFFDIDSDGDLDMFISNSGTQINGEFIGTIWHYENTGNRFNPSFELITNDFQSLSSLGFSQLKALFSDLDGDGNTDLILQARVGPLDARVFVLPRDNSGNFGSPIDLELNVSEASNPTLFDLNGDGLDDFIIGQQFGSMSAYYNRGSFTFSDEQTDFGSFENDFSRQNLSIAIGRFSSDAKPQVITVDSRGMLTLHSDQADENFRKSDTNQDLLLNNETLTNTRLGRASYLAAVDLFGDGSPSLVVGSSKGGLLFLRNIQDDNSSETDLRVSISPNPTDNQTQILTNISGLVDIISLNGRLIQEAIPIQQSTVLNLQFGSLPAGIYLIRVRANNGKSLTKRILIQR